MTASHIDVAIEGVDGKINIISSQGPKLHSPSKTLSVEPRVHDASGKVNQGLLLR